MADKMLIDATHPEETRVVVLRGNRVEEFDFESANRKQLRGNIYLAKVTRVEPSLQAAFVDYGGNRHGFLAFSEIHPDYYQIPVADRQALIAEAERAEREAEADSDNHNRRRGGRHRHRRSDRNRDRDVVRSEPVAEAQPSDVQPQEFAADTGEMSPGEALAGVPTDEGLTTMAAAEQPPVEQPAAEEPVAEQPAPEPSSPAAIAEQTAPADASADVPYAEPAPEQGTNEPFPAASEYAIAESSEGAAPFEGNGEAPAEPVGDEAEDEAAEAAEAESVESVGGADALEEAQERAPRVRLRQYKIQEVIKRRQVMLVQVVKEERGSKGAALTTYLSLAGRYSVLMPNTARGGGISRKITSSEDRSRLKEIAQELEVPEGMGVILRTAGASRSKVEVKRDFEYLLRLWEQVRDLTLKSVAPKLVYEEGSLVKRSIRDLYSADIDEIIVSGDEGYGEAREFMHMLMPGHARNVKLYKDTQPLFTRYGIESQLDAMFSPVVQLRSGGYIVINQAEALVAIDVNSGRATREHHIEDTATKTNCEAAEEVARQLRLRDLAGLIVIDFIDMDEGRNNRTVERRLKEALKHDRARIQVGRISHFGLLEMSRQRIRTSVLESSTEKCPVCGGSGHVRSVSSVALQLLRAVEEMLIKGATHNLMVRTRSEVALYVLNHKRAHLRGLEERFRISITVSADATVSGQQSYVVDRGEQVHTPDAAKALLASAPPPSITSLDEGEAPPEEFAGESEGEAASEEAGEPMEAAPAESGEFQPRREGGEREGGRRRRRRGRGRGRGRGDEPREPQQFTQDSAGEHTIAHEDHDGGSPEEEGLEGAPMQEGAPREDGEGQDGGRRRRRRGRRGGRRNRNRNGDGGYQGGEQQPREMHVGSDFPPVSEEDADAVAPAFDRPAPGHEPPPQLEAAPAEPAPAPQVAAEAPAEPPRRRSTIREPAPIASSETSPAPPSATIPPPAAPVVVSTASEESGQPKRGWWGKRLLGGDKS